ncbi:MAG: hypothetical protein R3F29_06885 [Planctomycetota bacterium]
MRLALALLLVGCVGTMPPAPTRPAPTRHVGPVTAIVGGGAFACSQAGVEAHERFFALPFRAVGLALVGDDLLVVGGVPGERGEVALCDANGGVSAQVALGADLIYAVAAPAGRGECIVGCADGAVHVLALPTLAPLRELVRHNAPCVAIAADPDGQQFATAGRDGIVHLYTVPDYAHVELADHQDGVGCLLFTADGLWSGARDGRVRLHRGDRLVRSYPEQRSAIVALRVCGERVVAGSCDGALLELDRRRSAVREIGRVAPLFALDWADDGGLLLGVTGGVERFQN